MSRKTISSRNCPAIRGSVRLKSKIFPASAKAGEAATALATAAAAATERAVEGEAEAGAGAAAAALFVFGMMERRRGQRRTKGEKQKREREGGSRETIRAKKAAPALFFALEIASRSDFRELFSLLSARRSPRISIGDRRSVPVHVLALGSRGRRKKSTTRKRLRERNQNGARPLLRGGGGGKAAQRQGWPKNIEARIAPGLPPIPPFSTARRCTAAMCFPSAAGKALPARRKRPVPRRN